MSSLRIGGREGDDGPAATRPIIKVCGARRPVDIELAARARATHVGINRILESPRAVTPECVGELVEAAAESGVTPVVLVDERTFGEVEALSPRATRAITLQSYAAASLPWPRERLWSVARVGSDDDLAGIGSVAASAVVVDARVEGKLGGTGQAVDRALARRAARCAPVILAGGLRPENIVDAIHSVRPIGVDAASGVSAGEGFDGERVMLFARRARAAFDALYGDGVVANPTEERNN